jgi:hypothetical protein
MDSLSIEMILSLADDLSQDEQIIDLLAAVVR